MSLSVEQFVEKLDAIGLLSADAVSRVTDSLPTGEQPADVPSLAKILIRQGKLTRYQATAVYQNKTKHLMFGEYVVVDKIGAGGMGLVLKAKHKRMKRTVAVKVLPAQRLKDNNSVERFYREVEAAARLTHPNIVHAYDAGEHEGLHFLVMEYVNGRDLAAIVHEHGRLPVEQAVECIRQAAQGLQYAHDEGIVHRDIKPGNLLLNKKGTVKILDMGLARLNVGGLGEGEEKQPEQLTQSGQIMGTVDYMAPEQAEDTRKADHRADIYALGCTLFRLVTGSPVYERDTVMQKLLAHREDEVPSMLQYRSDVPARLASVFQRMVAKNPDERYQSMTEVIAALETAFIPAPQAARPAPKKESSSSMALSEFFQHVGDQKVATKPQATAAREETIDHAPSAEDTGDSIAEVEPQQEAKFVQPAVAQKAVSKKTSRTKKKQQKLMMITGGGAVAVVLLIVLSMAFLGPGESSDVDLAKTTSPKPTGPVPPLAMAPFEAEVAKQHQQAWADYLGVPVEKEITLPGGETLTLVLIPPGEFLMGSTDEEQAKGLEEAKAVNDGWAINRIPSEGPQHRVRITRPFYLGKYEVTQAQWQSVMGGNPSRFKDNPPHPVEQVSWDEIQPFLAKLNESGSGGKMTFTLPTEAQWEYACRAGTTTAYYGGESEKDLRQYGWFNSNSGRKTHAVGELRSNAFGLSDMHGNVWECCQDRYAPDYYAKSPVDDPAGPTAGSIRVFRGGGWSHHPGYGRSAFRNSNSPAYRASVVGFRLAATIKPPPARAPFGEKEAKEHQKAWADYLGVDVERDIELPGGETLTMILIPPGEFVREENGKSTVRLTKPFYLGKYEMTQAQWQAVMGNTPSSFKDNPKHPVEQVSWDAVQPFLAKLNAVASAEKMTFALPTEAQWEYACRAGTTMAYSFGDSDADLPQYAWFNANSGGKTHPVGELKPNPFGLYDMHGNVWEWCADWYATDDYYATTPGDNPTGPSAGSRRVYRGGGWGHDPGSCRSASRNRHAPGHRYNGKGFRLAMTIPDSVWRDKASASTVTEPTANTPAHRSVAELNQQAEINAYPWLSPDGLTIFWTREGGDVQSSEIWRASRPSVGAAWQDARQVADGRMGAVSGDGLRMIYFPGGAIGGALLHEATRASVDEPFGEPQRIEELKGDDRPKSPWLSANSKVLVYQRSGSPTDTQFVICTRRDASSPWSTPQDLPTPADASLTNLLTWPHLSDDGLGIWFTNGGNREGEMVYARRTTSRGKFGDFEFLEIEGQRLVGRAPRYVAATGELFYSRPVGEKGWELWVVKQ